VGGRTPASKWVPRVGLGLGAALLIYAIVSLSIGEGGPGAEPIEGIEPVQELFGGIPQDGPYLGPEDAETTITVFTDLQCKPCSTWQVDVVDPLVERYARPGDAKLELRHYSLGTAETTLSALAAAAAGEQGREWQYADLLERNLDQAPQGRVDDQFLRRIADAVPEMDVDQWADDRDLPEVAARVESDGQTGTDLRLPGSGPSVVVRGSEGSKTLTGSPSQAEISSAVTAVGGPSQ
jgi:protein-disulfide isomerase